MLRINILKFDFIKLKYYICRLTQKIRRENTYKKCKTKDLSDYLPSFSD